nr:hypothetical protein [Tanacetum cinerariifolium]
MYGLGEFFPDPLSIINMGSCDDALKNLLYRSTWSFKPRCLSHKAQINDRYTMADVNVNAPAGQAPIMAPPVRTNDQILPRIRWVPIGHLLLPQPYHRFTFSSSGIQSNMTSQLGATDKMADVNAPSGQTPTMAPPLRADDQILPHIRFYGALSQEPILIMPRGPGRNFPNPYILLLNTNRICLGIHQGKEGHSNCDSKHSVHQADYPSSSEEAQVADEDADYQKAVEESIKDAYALPKGPLPPVVIREPESGKYQFLLEVSGKGKAKVTEEQVAHDLLSLQKHKKTSPADQYIFRRRVSEPTGSFRHDESPYALLGQSDNEEESEKVVLGAEKGGQDEGQAGSNLDETSKGQAGPDPGDAEAKVQSILSPVVHAGSDREHMDLDVADVSPQPSTEQLDEGFTATVYLNVQENLKLIVEEPVLLEEPASSSGTLSSLQHLSRDFSFGDQFFSDKPSDVDKNAETKVESMVNVTIQQALSSISLMTSPIIDLTLRPESPKEHQQLKPTTTDTTTTTTTTLPPPQAPQ